MVSISETLYSNPQITESFSNQFKLTTLDDLRGQNQAMFLLHDNQVVGIQFITYGLMVNANSVDNVAHVARLKGKEVNPNSPPPMALAIDNLSILNDIIDHDFISPELTALISKRPEHFASIFEGKAMLRLPIKPKSQVNGHLLNSGLTTVRDDGASLLQVLYFGRNQHTAQQFISRLWQNGIVPALTSMNHHKQNTIMHPEHAKQFCREKGVPLLLEDPQMRKPTTVRNGSYPIVEFFPEGLAVVREGNLSTELLMRHFPKQFIYTYTPSPTDLASPEDFNSRLPKSLTIDEQTFREAYENVRKRFNALEIISQEYRSPSIVYPLLMALTEEQEFAL